MTRTVWSRGALFALAGLLVLLVGCAVWMEQNRATAVAALRRWAAARQALQQAEPAARVAWEARALQAANVQAEAAVHDGADHVGARTALRELAVDDHELLLRVTRARVSGARWSSRCEAR